MYPLKFDPILKQVLWGGDKIIPFKDLNENLQKVGESWEISGVSDNESIVSNGYLKGKNLTELLKHFKGDLVGNANYKRFGDTFPLLIKFIDAKEDLSIQVHPDDFLAQKKHGSKGKTEMWYVVDSEKGAKLRSGFSTKINPEKYEEYVKNSTITEVLKEYSILKGDVFFIPAGRIHSIGAGSFIAEIQQTSDITYRIFDFNRKDTNGNSRELHTELAKEAIDYDVLPDYKTHYNKKLNEPIKLVDCLYFTTQLYELDREYKEKYADKDSFIIFICLEGNCKIIDDKENRIEMKRGDSILFPATINTLTIHPNPTVKFLETYII